MDSEDIQGCCGCLAFLGLAFAAVAFLFGMFREDPVGTGFGYDIKQGFAQVVAPVEEVWSMAGEMNEEDTPNED